VKLIKYFLIILFVFFVSCGTHHKIIQISRDIYKKNVEFYNNKRAKNSEKWAYYLRKKLAKKEKLNFILDGNIFYIIEGYDVVTNEIYTTIWNAKGEINFIYRGKTYQMKSSLFDKELKYLVSNWKLKEIKRLHKVRGASLDGLDMNAYKISLNNNKEVVSVRRFSFLQFGGSQFYN